MRAGAGPDFGSTTTAIRIERLGAPGVLVEREVPVREPSPGEVVLAVHAAGVNFADLLMRAGLYATVPPRPYSPGFEVAGVVVRVGRAVDSWRVGEPAVGLMRFGGYARHVTLSARQLFRYPEDLTAVEAAAIPVAFLTAWICLFEAGHARTGETALVLGAAGGVGTAAVQLARRAGLHVIGTAGGQDKCRFIRNELRADACFDSHGDWEADVLEHAGPRGIDVALDAVGGRATAACRRLLAPLGRLVFYGLSDAMPRTRRSRLRALGAWLRTPRFHPLSLVEPNIGVAGVHLLHLERKQRILPPALEEIYRGVAAGELRPIIDRTFPLTRDGAVEAHERIHRRRNIGKVVLAVDATTS